MKEGKGRPRSQPSADGPRGRERPRAPRVCICVVRGMLHVGVLHVAWSPAFPAAVLLRGSRAAWQWSPLVLHVEGRLAPAQLAKDRRRHRARVDHRIEVLGPHLQSLLLVRVRDRVRVRVRVSLP